MKTLFGLFIFISFYIQILAQTIDTTLIAYFPFNGDAIDVTGNGHNGTINGNATLVPDRFNSPNRAFTFPDQSSSISLANSTNLNLENGFTINAWIKYTYNNYTTVIVCKHVCGFVNGFFFGIDSDGQIQLWIGSSSWYTVRTNQNFIEDQWYMVTASYDAITSTARVFVNGDLGGSGSVVYNNFSSNPISIGESYLNNCGAGFMDGAVDEVKIYNRPLSDAEILDEYNRTYTDLVLFLPFNANANDESGNNNNGTVNGAQLTQDRFGINNRAYQFDGVNSYISIADNPNLFSDELTISWWYKMSDLVGGRVVIGWVDGGHRYQQFFSNDQLSYFNGYNLNQGGTYFNPIYTVTDLNVWKNVVVTYKKLTETTSTTSIYIDGELKQTDNHTLAMDYASGPDFFIGKNHNGNFFKGFLDDFRIYNRVLNNTEILALYNDSTTYFPDSLIAYFPFNGNANDESFLHNNGTVFNALLTTDRYASQDAAYYFNGNDSRIQIPENPFYDFGFGDFTITSWVNSSEIKTARIVSAGYDANDNIWGLGFGTHPAWGTGNRICYTVYSNNSYYNFSSDEITSYTLGEWTFIAASKVNNEIRFFKDGFQIGSIQMLYPSNSNSYMSIGCRQWLSNNLTEFFNGKIDEVKIFNKSFTDQEIWEMYKETTTAPNLLSPLNNSTINTLTPLIDWDSLVTATNYTIYIATDSLFSNIILSQFSNQSSYLFESGALSADIDYFWKVRTNNDGGIGPWSEIYKFKIILTDVEDEKQLPTEFALLQNYPNPFNPTTKITYHLPKASKVELKVYDIIGNEIATLVNQEKPAGRYNIEFDGSDISSGVYLYKIKTDEFIAVKKFILNK